MNPPMRALLEQRARPYKAAVDALPADVRRDFYPMIPDLMHLAINAYWTTHRPPTVNVSVNSQHLSATDRTALATLARDGVSLSYDIVSLAMSGQTPLHDIEDALAYLVAHEHFNEADYRSVNRSGRSGLRNCLMAERHGQN